METMPDTLEPIVVTPKRGTTSANLSSPRSQTTTGSLGNESSEYDYQVVRPSRKSNQLMRKFVGRFQEDNTEEGFGSKAGSDGRQIDNITGFILGIYALLLDVIGILLVFVGGEDFGLLDIAGSPTNIYFYFKGIPRYVRKWSDYTSILEVIPFVGILPLKFIGVLVVLYYDRHREKFAAASTALKTAK